MASAFQVITVYNIMHSRITKSMTINCVHDYKNTSFELDSEDTVTVQNK